MQQRRLHCWSPHHHHMTLCCWPPLCVGGRYYPFNDELETTKNELKRQEKEELMADVSSACDKVSAGFVRGGIIVFSHTQWLDIY